MNAPHATMRIRLNISFLSADQLDLAAVDKKVVETGAIPKAEEKNHKPETLRKGSGFVQSHPILPHPKPNKKK